MEFLIIGLATAFNFIVIKIKVEKKRYEDAGFDAAIFVAMTFLFSGSFGGMVVATIGSAVISLYLFASPPKFLKGFLNEFN